MLHLAWVRTICLEDQLDAGAVFVTSFAFVCCIHVLPSLQARNYTVFLLSGVMFEAEAPFTHVKYCHRLLLQ